MGPILRAEVKDTIIVHFWNKANQTLTMHPHVRQKKKKKKSFKTQWYNTGCIL